MADVGEKPALQVIVLGSGGGPKEDNTTAFLVRSIATGWKKGTVLAVDAGVHLAAISKIIETHKTSPAKGPDGRATLVDGPFEGLVLPYSSAKANAGYVTKSLVETYLITHPHLDHICGFVVNTASFPGSRPKILAGLPSTIEAFKTHIFNNVIWPNLTDENSGAGLVTYRRLVEGGSPALGDVDGKGYVEICEGLSVKTWSVSHGHCIEHHIHRGSESSLGSQADTSRSRNGSIRRGSDMVTTYQERICVNDSSAYFIRDIATGKEVLIFGDVEPDSISLSPRNKKVWQEAAPKIASGQLGGVFIECSYDDSQSDDRLFGHLAPRYLIQEMKVLANEVMLLKSQLADDSLETRKRKQQHNGHLAVLPPRKSARSPSKLDPMISPHSTRFHDLVEGDGERVVPLAAPIFGDISELLKGLKVVIIHIKERLDDGPDVGETILAELKEYEEKENLGCEFLISHPGQAVYL